MTNTELMVGKRPVAQIPRLETVIETSAIAFRENRPRKMAIPVYDASGKAVSATQEAITQQFIFGMKCIFKSDELQNPYGQNLEVIDIVPPDFFKRKEEAK